MDFLICKGAFNILKNLFRGTDKMTTAAQQLAQLVRDWCQGVIIGTVATVGIKGPSPSQEIPLPKRVCHPPGGA